MKNLITKGAKVGKLAVDEKELELINKFTIEPLTVEQVFTFKVAICDNEVDRDFEVFPRETLNKMSELFVGKTIIKDHSNSSDNQVARIYKTEIVEEKTNTQNGEMYAKLVAHCYMVKTDGNKDLITEIQAGIKKEVSVCCLMKKVVCSICGTDNRRGYCKHWGGEMYDENQCYFKLLEPKDAYEVSFVAVPAQPNAGVTKNYTGEEKTYQEEKTNTEKEDLINSDLELVKSFIFTEKERGMSNE